MTTTRSVLTLVVIASLAFVLALRADDPPANTTTKKPISKEEEAITQERLAKEFGSFESALLTLAQRLERSSKPEDRERAVVLRDAIKKTKEVDISIKFQTLVALLKDTKPISLAEIREVIDRSKMLADDLQAILALLLSDNREAQLKAEKERLRKLLEMLDVAIRTTKVARAQNEAGQLEKKSLASSQQKATQATKNVAKAMGGESKDSKKGDGKGAQGDSKGEGKGQGKSQEGKGDSKSKGQGGQNKSEGQQGDNKGDSQQSKKNESNQQNGPETPGRKQVQEAEQHQQSAEKNIDKDKRDDASKDQDNAIKKMEEAKRTLEEILRQLREEERERLLAALQARCERMLQMQIDVYDGTVRVDRAIAQNPEKKAGRTEEQRALQLSDREQDIVRQANQAIQLLENEGKAVAFPEVFTQVRDDMMHVARRLGKADVGKMTQSIEEDIIATLKEMIDALKKAAQANKSQQGQPAQGQPQNPSLIDLIAELKMIRSMQVKVNRRTLTYAEQYTGEQAGEPDIQKELGNLAERQLKVFEVTNNLARGKNK